jgi:prolyl oligopeptidase
MERVLPLIAQQITAKPEASPFYAPLLRMPDSIGAADRARLQAAGLAAISEIVIPAYARFDRYFRDRYLPACRDSDGIWDTPDGAAFYRALVASHTTTTLSPQEIHEIGLQEVARIRAEMDRLIAQVGFHGSFAEFLEFLRSAPQFYYRSPEELFQGYAATTKSIEPELVKLFGKLPRLPLGLRPIPMTSAPNTTTAYYLPGALDGTRAGYFYVNLYRPEVRPKYEMTVLTLHEAVPGHHLQIALAQELRDLPRFRRDYDITAFVEGWGLYAEGLGDELGLYRDPYAKFGQLTYDMWRAVRLVVDTGLHAQHWTRARAIEYFKANAAKTETDIVNEVDRYISWPGQALAYKIGQLRFLALRHEAEGRLGARFDLREFHDLVLSQGALPLDTLGTLVHAWIEKRLRE